MTSPRTLEATATREGKWWLIRIPEIDQVTQARTIDGIDDMAHSLAVSILNCKDNEVTVNVTLTMPDEIAAKWEQAKAATAAAQEATHQAAKASRETVQALAAQGYTTRDIGKLLGISRQRAHQLAADTKGAPATTK